MVPQQAAAAAAAAAAAGNGNGSGAPSESEGEEDEEEEERASWSLERRTAEELTAALVAQWEKPIGTLSKAGRAFEVRRGRRRWGVMYRGVWISVWWVAGR